MAAREVAAKEAALMLFVLVIRLFASLIGGLFSACAQMAIHSGRLVGAVAADARRPRPAAPPRPWTIGEKLAIGFFAVMALLIAYAVIRY